MSIHYVYILECKDAKGRITYYTGYTKSLIKRLEAHSTGRGAKYTRGKEVRLVYYEIFTEAGRARRREIEIKKMSPAAKRKLIESFNMDEENSDVLN